MTISKIELEQKYNSMKNDELAEELNISLPTLHKLLDENGIKRKGSGNAFCKDKIKVVS